MPLMHRRSQESVLGGLTTERRDRDAQGVEGEWYGEGVSPSSPQPTAGSGEAS